MMYDIYFSKLNPDGSRREERPRPWRGPTGYVATVRSTHAGVSPIADVDAITDAIPRQYQAAWARAGRALWYTADGRNGMETLLNVRGRPCASVRAVATNKPTTRG